jgi:hypothetical protein
MGGPVKKKLRREKRRRKMGRIWENKKEEVKKEAEGRRREKQK